MNNWIRIAEYAHEIPFNPNGIAEIKAAGKTICIARFQETLFAFAHKCPHAGGPLHQGEIEGTILTCPWHGWTYDLRTGACDEDPSLNLARYPVRLDGDDIMVLL